MGVANQTKKKRYWAFVLYPESAPLDWKDRLQMTGLPVAISPLHDKDIDPNGEVKKEHYHIILCYSGPTTFNAVNSLCAELKQPIPIPLDSVKGMYRYHIHADNPEKYQYSDTERSFMNGFNIQDYEELTRAEQNKIIVSIHNIIREKNMMEYAELLDFLLDQSLMTEYDLAVRQTILFNNYLKSRRYSEGEKKVKDTVNFDK